jgi:hypothetical protein
MFVLAISKLFVHFSTPTLTLTITFSSIALPLEYDFTNFTCLSQEARAQLDMSSKRGFAKARQIS